MPAPVELPVEASESWRQIFEGTDYRRRLYQFAIFVGCLVPIAALVVSVGMGWMHALACEAKCLLRKVWLVRTLSNRTRISLPAARMLN